ncbi:unnamed protein product [Polarella glacialis]|uniref:RCK N-terminal domain-containing protein n=1 Tax=Polarella glacialis TaxID=89957 RepID=A0A813LWR3_POLGL|nr:unnamed protein product [Polarella glacialis]
MSGLVCGEGPNCGPLSWNYVDTQLLISAGAWGLFFILGQILAIKSRTSNIDEYRERMEIIVVKLHGSPRILVIELVMSVSSCVLFMFRTYHRSMNEMSFLCEAVACIFYFVLFIPNWAVKHFKGLSSGGFFMLTEGVLELFLLGSMAGLVIVSHEGKKTWFSPSFLASKHFLAAWKRALIAMKVNTSVPATQIMDILVVTIVKVYFMAMLMLTVENLGDPELLKSFTKDKWNTVSSVYFVLTTVTTVGFGDIVPVTSLGRLFTIVIIFGGTSWLAQIAYRGGQIFAVNNSGGGFFVPIPQTKYIVVVGSPGAHMVRNFILELFHPDHSEDSDDLHISLILTPGSPAIEATLQLLKLPENIRINARVHVFQGSALNDDDLLRVTISSATCVFVLPDMLCHNMIQEDTENIIRMMSVQKFAAKTRIILLLMTAENKDLLQEANISSGSNITVVAYDQFKLEMAGKSCQVHGFGPLISNLCKSINIEEEQDAEGYAEDDEEMGEGPPGKPQWKKDFERGAGLELYEVDLSQVYSQRGATFMEVVVDIIEQTGGLVYLIGLVESRPDSKRVLVNPGPMYPIKASTGSLKIMGVFFASDREAILQCDVGMVFLGRRERALADEDTEMMGGGKKRLRNVAMAKFQEEDIPELQHVNLGQAQKETALQIARVVRRHRRALQPVRPPLKMLAVGGHVIVLCVGAQAAEAGQGEVPCLSLPTARCSGHNHQGT